MEYYRIGRFTNSDKIEFLIKSITINGKVLKCVDGQAVHKGEVFELCVKTEEDYKNLRKYIMTIEDVDKNSLDFEISLKKNGRHNSFAAADIKYI